MASKTNRLGCLRLTERCADILLSIRQEIEEGDKRRHVETRHVISSDSRKRRTSDKDNNDEGDRYVKKSRRN